MYMIESRSNVHIKHTQNTGRWSDEKKQCSTAGEQPM